MSGRNFSDEEKAKVARDVANYLLGDPENHIEPLSISHIMRLLNFKTRRSVYDYKAIAIKLNYLQVDDQGKAILPKKTPEGKFLRFTKSHPLANDPIIRDWFKEQNAKDGTLANPMLNMIENLLNTCAITPAQFIHDGKINKKKIESWRDDVVTAYKDHTMVSNKKYTTGKLDGFKLRMNYAIASLCSGHGITWARMKNSPMSRSIVGHGLYSDIRLTKKEFAKAEKFIIETWGLDSDIYRWFWVGVQSCARFGALFSMPLEFVVDSDNLLCLKCYESKTKHLNGGIWVKYIKRKNTIISLRLLKARHPKTNRIYENKEGRAEQQLKEHFIESLRTIYRHLGKADESYFIRKPNHAMRHIGAHFLLEMGNYTNHSIVKKLGGWHTTDEMERSYGTIPPDQIDKELDKYDFE
jgi:hypothetical protein